MSKKVSKIPDSDRTARSRVTEAELDDASDAEGGTSPDTSNKSGKHSSVEKDAAWRPGRGTGAQAKRKAGASGKPGLSSPNQGVPRSKTKGRRGSNA